MHCKRFLGGISGPQIAVLRRLPAAWPEGGGWHPRRRTFGELSRVRLAKAEARQRSTVAQERFLTLVRGHDLLDCDFITINVYIFVILS